MWTLARLVLCLAVGCLAPLLAQAQGLVTPMPVNITDVGQPSIAEKQNGSTGSGTSASATAFTTPVNVGDTIVIVCAAGNLGTLTPSDTVGSFTFYTAKLGNDGTREIGVFYAHATSTAAADQGKCADSSSGTIALEAYHVQAMLSPGNSYDVSASNNGSSTSASSGSFAPNFANEYAFGGIAVGTATVTFSALPVNWSSDATINPTSPTNLFTLGAFSQPLGLAVSQNLTATLSGSEPWLDVAATFSMETLPIEGVVMQGNSPWLVDAQGHAGAAFDQAPGSAIPTNALQIAGEGSGNTTVPVVCDNSAAINISSAATTQIIAISGTSGRTWICAIEMVASAADNVALISGSGTNCASNAAGLAGGTTAATGWNFAANGGLTIGGGIGMIFKSATTNNEICLVTSSTAQLSGHITYTQF